MSVKGKEKEIRPSPVIELDEEEDETANFFMKKRRRMPVRPASPIKRSPEPVHVASDDSDEGDTRKRKKPGRSKKDNSSVLPAWAYASSQSTKAARARGGSADPKKSKARVTETVIVIDSSPEPGSSTPSRDREISLTPPPELSEEKKAMIAQIIRNRHELPATVVEDDTPAESSNNRPSTSAVEDSVQISFRMVAPPERKENAVSQKAIDFYEKRRVVTCGRTQPISYAVNAFASMVRKPPEEIVITYQGRKIFSRLLTPQRIGVDYDGEFVCYEKDDWERLETARLAHEADDEDEQAAEAKTYDASSDSEAAAPVDDGKVRIMLMDEQEQVSATVAQHVTVRSLIKFFLAKSRKTGQSADGYKLQFDGETQAPDMKFGDLGAEEGDQLEIVKV